MGNLKFLLPADLPEHAAVEMERACVCGGQDQMPYATTATLQDNQLVLARSVHESGYLLAPWEVPGFGRLLLGSATLMERQAPYHLAQELARGTVNLVRGQTAEWLMGGLVMNPELADSIRQATLAFGKTITASGNAKEAAASTPPELRDVAQEATVLGCRAAEKLVAAYVQQVFGIRHQRQPRLETLLSCRIGSLPRGDTAKPLTESFNAGAAQVKWSMLEPTEGDLRWQPLDDIIHWLQGHNLPVLLGPLIDYSGYGMPDWLWAKDLDLTLLCDYLCEFVERVATRYKGRVQHCQLAAGSNVTGVVGRSEDELLWLTLRLIETARQFDANIELSIGLSQPFGEYLARQERSHSPLAFADTLLRTGVKLAGLDLEFAMGFDPRGSYCRHTLDVSRLIDLYSYLGVPLMVTLAYPSDSRIDAQADCDLSLNAGYWHGGFSPAAQAEWAGQFASLALCKPAVRSVTWSHFDDAVPHQFPHAGLIGAQGNVKPALERLTSLRKDHLK